VRPGLLLLILSGDFILKPWKGLRIITGVTPPGKRIKKSHISSFLKLGTHSKKIGTLSKISLVNKPEFCDKIFKLNQY
jgi:hypothetical protein